ncbi:glycosyltransferase family 4 protein [Rhodanobacter sp. AS-Z3]|uniref:glycosyltransferase family 4 protein n=1 Tax=Rhodanobacter sp. AS-Z3 TaxID=3031330 RepID=UPI00247AE23D|nr:glycosyltransferase family 4 protein [Rhodanobacter sp. AS-Z3]WEN16332.1 glycosyltransferase family 4 protein [Rhodanobacter sp. AS-Z3]
MTPLQPPELDSKQMGKSHAINMPSIRAPIVTGSGVMIVHRSLERAIPGYQIDPLSPWAGLAPLLLRLRPSRPCAITHTQPELGPWVAHRDSSLVATFHSYSLDAELLAMMTPQQRILHRFTIAPAVAASLKRAKWITAVSDFTAGLVVRHHEVGERLVVIKNGVDSSIFRPAPSAPRDSVNILFAGNPRRLKGSHHLEALADVLPDGVSLQYTTGLRSSGVDMPSEKANLVAMPRRSHEQMVNLYQQADILFFPTLREGLSLAVLEAMACGLPIVATRCSSMDELVEHDKGGFLFDMNDRAQMLRYLLKLADDPVLRAEMGAYNREKVLTNFTLQQMIDGYKEVFSACG